MLFVTTIAVREDGARESELCQQSLARIFYELLARFLNVS